MKICYFGDYDPNYSRNKIIIKGLRQNGVEVIECRTEVRGRNFKKLLELYRKHKGIRNGYDFMIVGYGDFRMIAPLARLITKKKLVWDAYYSIYDVWVFDKKVTAPRSLKALYHWFWDWISCKVSDKILLDTNEHINFFVNTFGIKREKFIKVLIGADDEVFKFIERDNLDKNKYMVSFHGKFIPVQGIPYIIEAANCLKDHKDIFFQIIGSGQEYEKVTRLANDYKLENVCFPGYLSYFDLLERLKKADLGLGNFGDTGKTTRVIANKSFELSALGIPQISADTPAMREFYTDRQDILFCERASGESLAMAILEMKADKIMQARIATNGQELFEESATPKIIAKALLNKLTN